MNRQSDFSTFISTSVDGKLKLVTAAFESMACGIVITDPNLPDHPIVYANPHFFGMTGFEPEEVIGRNCRLLQSFDKNQPGVENIRTAVKEKTDCVVTLRNYRKDSTMFWNRIAINPIFDSTKKLLAFIGVQTDVTDHYNASNQALRLDEVFAQAPAALYTTRLNGTVVSWNKACEEIFGYTEAEMIGASIEKIYPPGNKNEHTNAMGTIAKGTAIKNEVGKRLHKNGTLLTISTSMSPLKEGAPIYTGAVVNCYALT